MQVSAELRSDSLRKKIRNDTTTTNTTTTTTTSASKPGDASGDAQLEPRNRRQLLPGGGGEAEQHQTPSRRAWGTGPRGRVHHGECNQGTVILFTGVGAMLPVAMVFVLSSRC